ncbi:MAG: hypothetical protein JHC41_04735 [Nitrosopumilus sp.]|nr:hypothetical protein [Nitrosopumilus sp.]
MIQKSQKLKIIKNIIGGTLIAFSGYRFFNITNPSPFFVMYPGIAVLVIGIVNILKGILNTDESKTTKSVDISIGVIGIAVGLFVKFFTDASTSSISLIILFIIIQGAGFVGTGITQKGKSKAIRIPKIIVGVSVVPVIGVSFAYPDWSLVLISGLLSIKMLLTGIEIIVGAMGNKIAKNS